MLRREGQVIEVLFDADQWLSPADWAEPTLEPSCPIPASLNIALSFPRRCSTSSSISFASPIQLSPVFAPSLATPAWDAARKTRPRPTSSFLSSARGFDATSLFITSVPGAEDAVREARDVAVKQTARELKLVKRFAPRTNVSKEVATVEWMAKTVEITEMMQVQRMKDEIEEAEKRALTGFFTGIRRRFPGFM